MVLKDEILKQEEMSSSNRSDSSPRRGRLRRKKSKTKTLTSDNTTTPQQTTNSSQKKKKSFDLHSRARRSSPSQPKQRKTTTKTKIEDGAAMYEFSLWKGKRKTDNVPPSLTSPDMSQTPSNKNILEEKSNGSSDRKIVSSSRHSKYKVPKPLLLYITNKHDSDTIKNKQKTGW